MLTGYPVMMVVMVMPVTEYIRTLVRRKMILPMTFIAPAKKRRFR